MLDFGKALEAVRCHAVVARQGWNGKDMFITLVIPTHDSDMDLPYLAMKTVDGRFIPWLASQTDLLSDDWVIID